MIDLAALRKRLQQLQPALEAALVDVLTPSFDQVVNSSEYERARAFEDLLALSRGGDAMYDRPTVGVMYAGWYHAKRTHDATRYLAHQLLKYDGDLTVIDFGAGTGAAAWACVAIERARIDLGGLRRHVRLVSIESAVPMTCAGQDMWERLSDHSLTEGLDVTAEWHLSSVHTIPDAVGRVIGFAGFLFDASDGGRIEVLGRTLAESARSAGCDRLVMLTSPSKIELLQTATLAAEGTGLWETVAPAITGNLWSGRLGALGQLRSRVVPDRLNLQYQGFARTAPSWTERQVTGAVLRAVAHVREAKLPLRPSGPSLLLDPEQRIPAQPDRRLTAVIGSAGSGKSRVLVERLINTLLRSRRVAEVSVLVTTFNVDMIEQLAGWFVESTGRLGRKVSIKRTTGDITFSADSAWSVRFLNWDKVPSRLFGVPTAGRCSETVAFEQRLGSASVDEQQLLGRWPWLNASFLATELSQVVYGQGAIDKSRYVSVVRRGRPQVVPREHRPALWTLLTANRRATFTDARIEMLRRVRSGAAPTTRFEHVFVDEHQDFALGDFEVLASLVNDPRGLVVFGDETQAMNLGVGHARPRSMLGARWEVHHLEGSYRLPIRICEAIAPLARSILDGQVVQRGVANGLIASTEDDAKVAATDIVLPKAVKTATLGVRPIVVAGTPAQVSSQLEEIIATYRELLTSPKAQRTVITIAQHDIVMDGIVRTLQERDALPSDSVLEKTSMRKIKGLERPLVLWSTAAEIPATATLSEWIYTILTRTTNLLVIALSQRTTDEVKRVVTQLEESRLLFWSEEAESLFRSWKSTSGGPTEA